MKAIYRGAFADKPGTVYGDDEETTYPMKVGETYLVTINGDFYDVKTLEGERIHGWCGNTSLDDVCRDWFLIQEPMVSGLLNKGEQK